MYGLMFVILIALGSATVGFGGGWAVKGWKDGAEVARVESRDAVLTTANEQCGIDVEDVQKGVQQIAKHYEDKLQAANAEAIKATPEAKKHTDRAATIIAAPVPAEKNQCEVIIEEQEEYVQSRRTGS